MKEVTTTKTKKTLLKNTSHKSHTIIKSRDLNEAHFPNFGINEYKLFSLILSKAIRVDQSNQKEFIKVFCETHIVTPKEFHEIFETPINLCYGILKNSIDTLTNKKIIVKSSTRESHIPICSIAVYDTEKHHLEIKLSSEIIPYLDVSIKFVKTKLYQIAKFKSLYSIRLYELIMSFRSLGKCSISVERLRFLLGVGEDRLIKYADFKKYALIHAAYEVNKICNFDIKHAEKKEGKKVTKIELTCKKFKSKELDDNYTDNKALSITYEEDVRIRLVKLGVEEKVVNKYKNCSDAKLEKAYKAIKKAVDTNTIRENTTALFVAMMKV
jgi:plasmid replication initiation protein